jgi:hypothetical protein
MGLRPEEDVFKITRFTDVVLSLFDVTGARRMAANDYFSVGHR